jgi:hypothetical protein
VHTSIAFNTFLNTAIGLPKSGCLLLVQAFLVSVPAGVLSVMVELCRAVQLVIQGLLVATFSPASSFLTMNQVKRMSETPAVSQTFFSMLFMIPLPISAKPCIASPSNSLCKAMAQALAFARVHFPLHLLDLTLTWFHKQGLLPVLVVTTMLRPRKLQLRQ